MKKLQLHWLIIPIIALTAPLAHAQMSNIMLPAITCTALTQNLYYGSTDAGSHGQVTQLQTFLRAENDFPYQTIGVFGPLTLHAIKTYQATSGVPATGYVGPLTRASIQKVSCASTTTSPVSIQSITPTSGPIGTTVSISGYGFTSSNTVLFSEGAINNIPVSSTSTVECFAAAGCPAPQQVLTFTIPS
jgi:peptidoglycan hydrolase-like protein with peptidoglycan-binding domain